MERKKVICPICGIQIYMNHGFNYSCPIHNEFKLDYVTGKLVEVNPPKEDKSDYYQGC